MQFFYAKFLCSFNQAQGRKPENNMPDRVEKLASLMGMKGTVVDGKEIFACRLGSEGDTLVIAYYDDARHIWKIRFLPGIPIVPAQALVHGGYRWNERGYGYKFYNWPKTSIQIEDEPHEVGQREFMCSIGAFTAERTVDAFVALQLVFRVSFLAPYDRPLTDTQVREAMHLMTIVANDCHFVAPPGYYPGDEDLES